jgi:hypothetical protein
MKELIYLSSSGERQGTKLLGRIIVLVPDVKNWEILVERCCEREKLRG